VELLGHAGRQVFALINDLLDSARMDSGRLLLSVHRFNLVDLVELQLELLRERAQAQGLWLRVFVRSEATGWVSGDAQRVAQIVTNLVANAIKFTRQGGVTVELSREADGRVLISVQDTGLGIAAEQLERIFQPLRRLTRALPASSVAPASGCPSRATWRG
jgi:signal transduction histidine kinase